MTVEAEVKQSQSRGWLIAMGVILFSLLLVVTIFWPSIAWSWSADRDGVGHIPCSSDKTPVVTEKGQRSCLNEGEALTIGYVYDVSDLDRPAPNNGICPFDWKVITLYSAQGESIAQDCFAGRRALPKEYEEVGWKVDSNWRNFLYIRL